MTRIVDPFIAELDQEAVPTRRALERVPNDKLGWKPHPRSMSLGYLATHIATLPGGFARFLLGEGLDLNSVSFELPMVKSAVELCPSMDESVRTAKEILGGFDDRAAMATWKFTKGDKVLFAAPRIAVVRSVMLNHWYHHRGQLTVYLRLLDIPVPSIYGPSADENPFAD